MNTHPTIDLMIAVLPDIFTTTPLPEEQLTSEHLDDLLRHWVTYHSHSYVLKQYENRMVCPIITFEKIEWQVIGRAEDAGEYVVDHDCEGCQAGKNKAETFLHSHPDTNLVFVSIHYTESWPLGTTATPSDDRVPVEEL